jgi:hypothetical protein
MGEEERLMVGVGEFGVAMMVNRAEERREVMIMKMELGGCEFLR